MKRITWFGIVVFAVGCLQLVFADRPSMLEEIDFKSAYLYPSGPESFYLRNVQIDGVPHSVQLRQSEDGRFVIHQVNPESENIMPAEAVWDMAQVRYDGEGRIAIDGVIFKGRVLQGVFELDEDERLVLHDSFTEGSLSVEPDSRAEGILRLVLESEIAKQELEREGLRQELQGTKAELERMQDRVEEAETAGRDYLQEIEGLINQVEQLERVNHELEREIGELERRLGDNRTAGIEPELLQEIRGLRTEIESLRAELHEADSASGMQQRYTTLRNANQELEQRLLEQLSRNGIIGALSERFTVDIPVEEGSPAGGSWNWSDGILHQTDRTALFARYRLPAPQDERPTMYRLQARSAGEGWVGYGIHIQASDVSLQGYGHGKSLLIWLTRDQRAYGDTTTYLQAYTSFDDVNMRKVLHAAADISINEFTRLEILVEPESNYVTVAADGQDIVRYKLFFPVEPGVEVALRSLNAADFRELEVLTVPEELRW